MGVALLLCLLCGLLACRTVAASVDSEEDCRLSIRPNTTANSWQSSTYRHPDLPDVCFHKPYTAARAGHYTFFHTSCDGKTHHGYHWFVVQLNNLMEIASVTIKNRDAKIEEERPFERDLSIRASEIEVWTSQLDQLNFGSDHCDAGNISSQFNERDWMQCGRTPSVDAIKFGQILTVNCNPAHQARYVLLRKNLASVTPTNKKCIGFEDMWITRSSETVVFDPPGPWIQNSRVAIKCTRTCTGRTSSAPVMLCPPRKSCATGQTHIDSLQLNDYGNYTCQIDGHVVSSKTLSLLYSPAELTISPSGQMSCGAESPANVTFKFVTSAAEPKPEHSCSALDSDGRMLVMRQDGSPESAVRGSATSNWLCVNCSSAAKLTVQCGSLQRNLSNLSRVWTCEPPAELSIEFGQVKELKQWLEINFEFFTSSSSPESEHRCSAASDEGAAMEMTQWNDEKRSRDGSKKTYWMARVQLPWQQGQLSVNCTAAHVSAWTRQVKAAWQRQQPSSMGALAYALIGTSAAGLVAFTLLGLLCYCKLKQHAEVPLRLMQAGTAHAMRYISGTQHHGVIQHPQQLPYDNAEDENVYELIQKVETAATVDEPAYLP